MLTQDQKSALNQVWHGIAADVPDDFSPAEKAELIIDAGRLTMMGFPEIDKQMREFVQKDYSETLNMIARELHL